jgi:hypothetical protein
MPSLVPLRYVALLLEFTSAWLINHLRFGQTMLNKDYKTPSQKRLYMFIPEGSSTNLLTEVIQIKNLLKFMSHQLPVAPFWQAKRIV